MYFQDLYQNQYNNFLNAINKQIPQILQTNTMPQWFSPVIIESCSTGKRFRPLITIITYEGLGGQWQQVLELSCSIELLHKASLLHDDLVDKDTIRRGKPTFWARYGEKQAIVTGDLLIGISFRLAQEWARQQQHCRETDISYLLSHTLEKMAMGELLDVKFEDQSEVDYEAIRQMIYLKSGSLISAAFQLGAIAADAPSNVELALAKFGDRIGIAFQIINDLNDVMGLDVKDKRAKDLIGGKKTFVTVLLNASGIEEQELTQISDKKLKKILEPATSTLDEVLVEATENLSSFPDGVMKKAFLQLIEQARKDWRWF